MGAKGRGMARETERERDCTGSERKNNHREEMKGCWTADFLSPFSRSSFVERYSCSKGLLSNLVSLLANFKIVVMVTL